MVEEKTGTFTFQINGSGNEQKRLNFLLVAAADLLTSAAARLLFHAPAGRPRTIGKLAESCKK